MEDKQIAGDPGTQTLKPSLQNLAAIRLCFMPANAGKDARSRTHLKSDFASIDSCCTAIELQSSEFDGLCLRSIRAISFRIAFGFDLDRSTLACGQSPESKENAGLRTASTIRLTVFRRS